jgi:hypothetical protein
VYIDTSPLSDTSDLTLPATIHAAESKPSSSGAVDGSGEDFVVVDQSGSEDYTTIQDAIDNVSGTTIFVRSGTYNETIDIQGYDGLTIEGEDGATIAPTTTLDWGSETNFPDRTTGVRVVDSTNVAFENLTFDFEAIDDTSVTGAMVWESTGAIRDSVLRDMSNPNDAVDITSYLGTNDPGSSSFSDSNRATFTFENTDFIETGRIGINTEDFVHAVVENNTFETTDAGYAVEIGSESTGEIRDNTIQGYNVDFSTGAQSAGIYIENAYPGGVSLTKDVTIENNEVADSTVGIRIGNEYDDITGDVAIETTLTENYIHDNDVAGVSVTDSGAEDGSSVTVTGSNNTVENNSQRGYYIFESNDQSEDDDGNITVDLEQEAITGNDVGVRVESTSTSPVESFNSVAVTSSNIENNATYGVQNTVGNLLVDATDNWWGASDGPSGEGSGSGDAVSQNVDVDPYASSSVSNTGHSS